jgi:hypothetical protein
MADQVNAMTTREALRMMRALFTDDDAGDAIWARWDAVQLRRAIDAADAALAEEAEDCDGGCCCHCGSSMVAHSVTDNHAPRCIFHDPYQPPPAPQPPPPQGACRRCGGSGRVSDMMTASIRTDTLPPEVPCPDCGPAHRGGG